MARAQHIASWVSFVCVWQFSCTSWLVHAGSSANRQLHFSFKLWSWREWDAPSRGTECSAFYCSPTADLDWDSESSVEMWYVCVCVCVCVCSCVCVCVCLSCACCIVQCEWREGVGADVAGHGMLCPQHQPATRADAVPANPITSHRHWLLESAAENTQVSSRQFITKFWNFCWSFW